MKYIYTSDDVQAIADVIARFLTKQRFSVRVEAPIDSKVNYRTTLLAQKAGVSILVDVQHKPTFEGNLKELAFWLQKERIYSELYLATHESSDPTVTLVRQLRRNGVGLILAGEADDPEIFLEAQNPALVVCPDPTLKFGRYKSSVKDCLYKFNSPNSFLTATNPRMDAARDMCEIVEGLTEDLALTAVKKKTLKLTEKNIKDQDWSGQINTLASKRACVPDQDPIIDNKLKNDLHSFRGVRILLAHRTRSKREEIERQQQLTERMMMGPRLVSALVRKKSQL